MAKMNRIYRSGDHLSSRWGVDGWSYVISKSQGISKMVSGFKDCNKQGMRIAMSSNELTQVKRFFELVMSMPKPTLLQ